MTCGNLFYDNKYTRCYFRLIARANDRRREEGRYYEEHHIIPLSIQKDSKLVVAMTAKEHYVCHLLLLKMVIDSKHRRSMAYALFCMRAKSRRHTERFTGAMYGLLKTTLSAYNSGENNPFYGKGHLLAGKNNGFYGRHHSEATKATLREKCRLASLGECNPMYGKTHSEATKKRCSEMRSGKAFPCGPYRLVSPNGDEFIVREGIYAFCKSHGLVGPNVIQAAQKGHRSRGWLVELYEDKKD